MIDPRNAREYIEHFLRIRDKGGQEVLLRLNPAQERLYNVVRDQVRQGKPVRVIVLKARQMGFSTLISAILFHACAMQRNRAAMLVAHTAEATSNLHAMHKRFYDGLPAPLRPMRAASNAIELRFQSAAKRQADRDAEPGLRSWIRCATAGGEGIGRSATLQYVHASEFAFWPGDKAETLLGLMQAVPPTAGTMVFIESTANGYDEFKHRWDDAVAGRSEFVPVFFPWYEEAGYRRAVPPGTVWTPEERELAERYGLDPEQLAWRRWAITTNCGGDLDKFHQEYPISPEEAFITSGSCYFSAEIIQRRLSELWSRPEKPVRRGAFVYKKRWDAALQRATLYDIRFEERDGGPVTIWAEPEKGTPYVLGGDTAGEGSDWFSAYVIDNTSAQMCARIYQQQDEAGFTEQVFCLGQHFNTALIGLEVNFSTYPVRVLEELGYPRQFVREAEDDYTHAIRRSYGWRTDGVTRPAMLSELRATVEAHPEIVKDPELLQEMLVFVKDGSGRPAAQQGEHDDLVMGYGITLKIRDQQTAHRKQVRQKYTRDMLEDWLAGTPKQRAEMERMWGGPPD